MLQLCGTTLAVNRHFPHNLPIIFHLDGTSPSRNVLPQSFDLLETVLKHNCVLVETLNSVLVIVPLCICVLYAWELHGIQTLLRS
jgi:hypothetical protein